jgi:predicted AlkP superfamily pyrophosphatase or phosphodiesterase
MARLLLLALLALPVAVVGGGEPRRSPAAESSPVKLVVVVYFDQFRGDYLGRWGDLFGDGGFRRLTTDGAWFTDCHYPYATTTTGPGHASCLAGCGGAVHGVINNEWYDRAAGKVVYCAASDRYQFVPPPAPVTPPADAKQDTKTDEDKLPGNPDKLLAETTADRVKAAGGRVFGLSLKDRSAIFPSGHRPDGAYWFTGRFVTSTYYRDSLPKWVSDFNAGGTAEKWVGKTWERSRPDVDYTRRAGPDDAPGEGVGVAAKPVSLFSQGRTFPHPFPPAAGELYYKSVAASPAGNELLLALAKTCVEAEKLGTGDKPDLLTVSFSSNDLIGHAWGPDSQEVLDVTLRSDRVVAELLTFLDEKVGAGKYAVVLTADHGVAPVPPLDRRIRPQGMILAAERFLQATYGKPGGGDPERWLEALAPPHIYLNHRLLAAKGLNPEEVAGKLAAWLAQQPGIQTAFTAGQLRQPSSDPLREQVRLCYHPARGGDVVAVPKPYFLIDRYDTGTSHGTPHEYDTHVPLVVFAPGVAGGKHDEKVTPLHAAAVVSKLLGVTPPATAQYPVPATLYGK